MHGEPEAGELYVALFEWDQCWYRARVAEFGGKDDIEVSSLTNK